MLPFTEHGTGTPRCGLHLELPAGLALSAPPVVRRGPEALHVQLWLTQGSGGPTRFDLAECVPASLPLRVSF